MNPELNTLRDEKQYHVVRVEKTETPDGMSGNDWHRYVIGHGNAQIEGLKPGSMETVTEHARSFAEALNSRVKNGARSYALRPQKKK